MNSQNIIIYRMNGFSVPHQTLTFFLGEKVNWLSSQAARGVNMIFYDGINHIKGMGDFIGKKEEKNRKILNLCGVEACCTYDKLLFLLIKNCLLIFC